MCGLVCVITKGSYGLTSEQRDAFNLLLYIDVLRGEDSTGAFVVDNIGNVQMAKDAIDSSDFLKTKEYKDLKATAFQKGWAMVGHNRKATKGWITDSNAHPFIVDENIVLVHNGTLIGDHKHHADTEVDSEAIAHVLSKETDVEEALRKINGAYALIWYNVAKKELNFVRNKERPLWYLETNDAFIFASEECFLDLIIAKLSLKPMNGPFLLKEDQLSTFKLGDDKKTSLTLQDLDCSYSKHNPIQTVHNGGWGSTTLNFPSQRNGAYEAEAEESVESFLSLAYHRDACAYPPANRAAVSNPDAKVISTINKKNVERFMETIKADHKTITFSDFGKLKEELKEGTKVKVIVNDLTEATDEDCPSDFLMIGKYLANPKCYSVFHMHEKEWDEAVKKTYDGVFEIEITTINWVRTGQYDPHSNIDEWNGVVCIHGKNPTLIHLPAPKTIIIKELH